MDRENVRRKKSRAQCVQKQCISQILPNNKIVDFLWEMKRDISPREEEKRGKRRWCFFGKRENFNFSDVT